MKNSHQKNKRPDSTLKDRKQANLSHQRAFSPGKSNKNISSTNKEPILKDSKGKSFIPEEKSKPPSISGVNSSNSRIELKDEGKMKNFIKGGSVSILSNAGKYNEDNYSSNKTSKNPIQLSRAQLYQYQPKNLNKIILIQRTFRSYLKVLFECKRRKERRIRVMI